MEAESTLESSGTRAWKLAGMLPCSLSVEIRVPGFRVADLLALHSGQVVQTRSAQRKELPVRINGALVAWAEFEVVAERLAVRLTELV